jgi:cephalosporin-C deacetylase-like acetyl esterase
MRAVDYLETRPEVDARRIGITGISGGGAVSWYAAAADERFAVAAPVCGTITFGSQAANWVAAGQCDCIYFHNTYLTDFPIVAALIAPRPLIICSGQKDRAFPPDGYRQVYKRGRRIYDLYGQSDRIREVDEDVGHTDSQLFRKEVRQWLNRWLKGDLAPVKELALPEERRESAEELACLKTLPRDTINYRIHESFLPTPSFRRPRSLTDWESRRTTLVRDLKDKVFRAFPKQAIPFNTQIGRSDGGWAARYAAYKDITFQSEPGVTLRAQLLLPKSKTPTPKPRIDSLVVYAKRPGDSIYFLDLDELLPVMGRVGLLILNPRLTEHPVSAFEYAEIERTASWLGRTIGSMQVWDILRAVDWVVSESGVEPETISVYGKGDMGILALYAGLLDPRIQQVILRDPPASHKTGPALVNVLRLTDIPEAVAAFAPRRLSVLRDIPAALEPALAVYRLYGAARNMTAAGSLPEALDVWKYDWMGRKQQ